MVREGAVEGDGEPAPKVGGEPLPDHVRGVVVAVSTERLSPGRAKRDAVAGSLPLACSSEETPPFAVAERLSGRPVLTASPSIY